MHSHKIGRRYPVSPAFFLSVLIPSILVALIGFLIKPIGSGARAGYETAKGVVKGIDEFPRKFYDYATHRGKFAPQEEAKPPVPEVMEVTETAGFVKIPAGTRKVLLHLRRGKPSPWLVLPSCHRYDVENRFYPIYYERWGNGKPTAIYETSPNFDLKDGLLRILTNFEDEVTIHLVPK